MAELDAMTEEGTVDCYDEEEQLAGLAMMVEDNLEVPFETHGPRGQGDRDGRGPCVSRPGGRLCHVWAFLRDARDQALIQPGAIVVAGDEDAPAVAEVVDIVDKPADRVVHLRILPGLIEDYQAVIQRAVISA